MNRRDLKYLCNFCLGIICSIFLSANARAQSVNESSPAPGTIFTLEQYENMALANSTSVQIARERIKQAENIKKAAFTQLLPSFNAVGAYTWNQKKISMISEDALLPVGTKMSDGSFGFTAEQVNNRWAMIDDRPVPLDADGVPFDPKVHPEKILWKNYALLPKDALTFDMRNVFVGGIGFSQPIFMGFKIRELYNISKNSQAVAEIEYDKLKEDLCVEVDQAYWMVVSLLNKQKLAQQYVELLTTLHGNVEKAIQEGVATKGDLLNVKVKLNEANLALTKATNGIALAKMQLFYLSGLDVSGDYGVADTDFTNYSDKESMPNEYDVVSLALNNRLELKELERMEDIAGSQVKIARSRFMPNIVATGNYYVSNPNIYNGFRKSFKGAFAIGVGITIPIFHFGDRIYTLKAAQNEHNIVLGRIEQARKLITLQSTMSKLKLDEARQKLLSANSNIDAAKENLRLADLSYKEGLITLSDLLAAQTAFISAQSEQIDASIDERICRLTLLKNMGIPQVKE